LLALARFQDHFSGHATDYARYRPDYPDALFDWLADVAPSREAAWDCATGNGQAAAALARRFSRVVGTDASARQLREAARADNVLYAVATAESSPVPTGSVGLVTVAQALHWFDRERFWREATRVLVPGGVIAVWSYDLLHVSPEVDRTLHRLYRDVVGPYWPPERALVEAGYGCLEFPFERIEVPSFAMEKRWDLAELVGYVRTWSATRRYVDSTGRDPLIEVQGDLAEAWGNPSAARPILWDLDLRAGRRN
jgi:SAM-dependent methyltransferase